MNRRALQLAGVITVTILAVFALRDASVDSPRPIPTAEESHVPDYIVDQFNSTLLGRNGKPLYRLGAVELKHFSDDDTSELQQPRYAKFPEGAKPVFISADRGWMNADETELLLVGNVQVNKGQPGDTQSIKATMETLRIFPKEDFAETDSPVHLEGQGTVADAIGMHADLANDRLTLLSKVRGKQEPRSR
ncbi:MAG: LPS export ABC transporter periplasmic protein LptC [Gammaproteobacteria bacterium]|nr:LPS export ABC transporter periplasmic protein LptC [Gammaproteobacteria bacterium]